MYKRASRFQQTLVRRVDRDTGGRPIPVRRSAKSALMRRLDREVERARQVEQRDGRPQLVKRLRKPETIP